MFALFAPPPPPFPWETCKYKDPETHVVSHEAVNALFFPPSSSSPYPGPRPLTQKNIPRRTRKKVPTERKNNDLGTIALGNHRNCSCEKTKKKGGGEAGDAETEPTAAACDSGGKRFPHNARSFAQSEEPAVSKLPRRTRKTNNGTTMKFGL